MSLAPGEEIGEEVHKTGDQFFRVEKGKGEVWIDGERTKIKADDAFIIPAGARHNVINSGSKRMKLYTLYSPAPASRWICRGDQARCRRIQRTLRRRHDRIASCAVARSRLQNIQKRTLIGPVDAIR